MLVRELRAGDEFVLGGVRITVLAVEGEEAVLGVTGAVVVPVAPREGDQERSSLRGVPAAFASKN